jgi:glycosyltransferase involved in cell wall biosynthesis
MTHKILMACGTYWGSPFQVGSHHIAKEFANAGYQVAFISDAISPLHPLSGITNELKERFKFYRQGGIWDSENKIWAYVPAALATPHNKPILRSEWILCNWQKLTWPNVFNVVAKNGFEKVDTLYFDSINQAFWLDVIPHDKSIFRIVDKSTGYSRTTSAAIKQEEKLAQQVDLVVYSAKSLEGYIQSLHPKNTMHLPNGVNFEHFANGSKTLPAEYQNIKKPIVVYVGAMDVWFDYELVNYAARELPQVSFVLIGPDNLARQRLADLSNLHLLGRRDYSELPAYLHNADVGIIPFDINGHTELIAHINPLKLYEYMACNLPVVSVSWEELELLKTPARLSNTYQEFTKAIIDVIENNRIHNIKTYQSYIKTIDWTAQVKQLNDKILSI